MPSGPFQWTVQIIKPTAGGYGTVTDVTRIHNLQKCTFQPTAQGRQKLSTLYLYFPATAFYDIHEGYRFAAGWTNAGGAWDPTQAIYAGYIVKQKGDSAGANHILTLSLSEFDILLPRTHVKKWPDPTSLTTLYPLGFTAAAWLVKHAGDSDPGGTVPYDGLLPARLGGFALDLSGVDAAVGAVVFDATAAPGSSDPTTPARGRAWGKCTLRKPIDDILECIKFINPTMDPVAYMDAVVNPGDPTQVIPRFRLVDQNDTTGTPVATFNVTPGAGEYRIEKPFGHARDFTEVAARNFVGGAGTALIGGSPDLVHAVGYNATHAAAYQTTWQTEDGWAAVYTDETIGDVATAQGIAATMETLNWGAQGRITFRSSLYVPPGRLIILNIPQEGQSYAPFRVNDVTAIPNIGRPLWEYVVGAIQPDTAARFQREVRYQVGSAALRALGRNPGAPAAYPLSSSPVHYQQNVIQNADYGAQALSTRPGWVDPGGPAPGYDDYASQIESQVWDAGLGGWVPGFWTSGPDARPHPYVVDFGYLAAAGTYATHIPWTVRMRALDLKGTGTVQVQKNGVDVGLPATVSGTWAVFPLGGVGWAPGDDLAVVVSGVSGAGVSVKVWE